MGTFWLKIAVIAAIIIGAFFLVSVISVDEQSESQERQTRKEKTYYDVIQEDDKRLRAEPQATAKEPCEPGVKAEPVKLTFRELSFEEQVQAGKLFEMALFYRKQGRLPKMGTYKLMVDCCRRIIEEYPGSTYSYKAKRMLADLRPRDRKKYKITEQEIDLSSY